MYFSYGLDELVDVDVVMRGDRDDRGVLSYGAFDELLDLLVVRQRLFLGDDVDLVLHDDDLLHPDDGERHEVLLGLGLGTLLVRRHQQQRAVHHGGAGEHGGHQGLVAGCVHEGD